MFAQPTPSSSSAHLLKRVAIVGGTPDSLEWLEPMLDPGSYQMLFLDPDDAPYSQIREEHPDLVVLAVRIEDLDAFGLLSMLKMDEETSQIPVVTYTTEYEGQPLRYPIGARASDPDADSKPVLPLN